MKSRSVNVPMRRFKRLAVASIRRGRSRLKKYWREVVRDLLLLPQKSPSKEYLCRQVLLLRK
ncbi:hypothetical protein HAX54_033989, partial [Datura stramonium]|nr:hypothetical protein [Datura stramonium]